MPSKDKLESKNTMAKKVANHISRTGAREPNRVWAELQASKEDLFALNVAGRPDITKLKKRLLQLGGESFQRNDYMVLGLSRKLARRLLKGGRQFPGGPVRLFPMVPNECHTNVQLLAVAKKVEWWFGLALSKDDVWRLHSWGVKNGSIIETTERRAQYFGVQEQVSEQDVQLIKGLLNKQRQSA